MLLAVGGGALLLQRLNRKERQPEPRAVKANLKGGIGAGPQGAGQDRRQVAGAGDLRSTN